MKKLMLLAAVAAMGAMSAKADWTIKITGDSEGTYREGTATVKVMAYWDRFDPAKYNNLYVLLESDWDGTVASLEKNLFNMTFENITTGPGGIGFDYNSGERGYSLPGERILAFSGSITDEGDGQVMVEAVAPIYAIFTDAEKSGYFAYGKEAHYFGNPEDDLQLLFYLDANIPDSQPQSFAAAPEPTSGLLLLLGVAGLALRRKRA